MSKELLVVFDIDETLIHYVAAKYSHLFWDLPEEIQVQFKYVEDESGSIIIFRPLLKELFDYYANAPNITIALWTYSERDYSEYIADVLIKEFKLDEDIFLFRYGAEDMINEDGDEDEPKNLEKVYEDFPEQFNKFNTFLVDDAISNIKHKVNMQNSLLIEPFAPFGAEKVREDVGESAIETALNDDKFLDVIKISEAALKDIMGCDIEDIKAGEEAIFNIRRIGPGRMNIEELVKTFVKPGTVTNLVTIGNPKASKKLEMICGGKKKNQSSKKGGKKKKKTIKKKKGGKKKKKKKKKKTKKL